MDTKSKNGRKRLRGIFAIEGEWQSDLRGGLSFRPLLEIIRSLQQPFCPSGRGDARRTVLLPAKVDAKTIRPLLNPVPDFMATKKASR